MQKQSKTGLDNVYDIKQFALVAQDRRLLHQRIEKRLQIMMKLGFENEVKALYQRGDLDASKPAIRSVGYRQLWDYFEGHCSLSEAEKLAVIATRQLAKRQQTWLRSWPNAQQVLVDGENGYYNTDDLCKTFLKTL